MQIIITLIIIGIFGFLFLLNPVKFLGITLVGFLFLSSFFTPFWPITVLFLLLMGYIQMQKNRI